MEKVRFNERAGSPILPVPPIINLLKSKDMNLEQTKQIHDLIVMSCKTDDETTKRMNLFEAIKVYLAANNRIVLNDYIEVYTSVRPFDGWFAIIKTNEIRMNEYSSPVVVEKKWQEEWSIINMPADSMQKIMEVILKEMFRELLQPRQE